MEELKDAKVSIKVGGAQTYNDAPFFVSISDEKIILKTKIGKNEVKSLEIAIEKNVYVKEVEDVDGTTKTSSQGDE